MTDPQRSHGKLDHRPAGAIGAYEVAMRQDVVKQGAGFGAGIEGKRGNAHAVHHGCVCRETAQPWRAAIRSG